MSYFGHRWSGRFDWQSRLTRSLFTVVVIVVLAAGGSSAQRPSPNPPIDNRPGVRQANGEAASVPNMYDAQLLVEEYIRDGRYDEDVAKVVDQARAWLEERAKTAMKPAIVLDIDETSLSNWPAYRVNGWVRIINGTCDLQQGPCGLRAWQALGQSKAIAPTLSLARRARELSVAVFFITGRPASLREATERNLRDQGYQWTAVILQPEGAQFASAADFKAPERRKLTDQGYTIVLSLGDQNSDLMGGYAEKTF